MFASKPTPFLKRNPNKKDPELAEDKELMPKFCANATRFEFDGEEVMHMFPEEAEAPAAVGEPHNCDNVEIIFVAVEKVNTEKTDGKIRKNETNNAIREPPAALVHGNERRRTPT